MNIFVIPSWYPTEDEPHTGIFIKEQAIALATCNPLNKVGISTWGSHVQTLLLEKKNIHLWGKKILNGLALKPGTTDYADNCRKYFTPSFTWSRSFLKGNISKIIDVNEAHFNRFAREFSKPDIIHAHTAYPGGYVAMKLGKKHGIPYVITEQMSPFPLKTFDIEGSLHPLILVPYQRSQKNIAVSRALYQTMAAKGVPNLTLINNLTDEEFFQPATPGKRIGQFHFAFIGRMEEQKGVKYLIEAAALLKESGASFTLTMGGEGSELADHKEKAKELGLTDHINWLGTLSREGVKAALQACDAFVLPSIHENHPLVLLEALAVGKPVIATRCGGSEEIVAPEVGMVVDKANTQQLFEAMGKFSQRSVFFEANEIRQYFLTHFSKQVITQQLEALYKEVIDGFSAP
ncbi:glycosyltransferase [uncultured Imperialibacter sp.]|uniref:glycosyltransferase n=1 Tax=uncultured Imperialibacter sp. TaxID=1672639 RepID=UPI0030D7C044|tara:strand:+ start:766 stop:1980 length:1215 start_codon:yes stop_codon:yes gene_type:complete